MKWIRKLTQADNVYESLKPLILLSYISGLDPIRLGNITPSKSATDSTVGFIMYFCQVIGFVTCLILSYRQGETIIGYFFKTEITRIGDALQRFTGVIGTVTIFSISMVKRKATSEILVLMSDVDNDLFKLNQSVNYNKTLQYSYVVMICMIIFNCCFLIISYTLLRIAGVHPSVSVFLSFSLPQIQVCIVVVKFLCMVRLIRHRFVKLNKIVSSDWNESFNKFNTYNCPKNIKRVSFFHNNRSDIEINRSQIMSTTSIKQVTQIHNLLCDLCDILDDYFSYPMLAIVGIAFLYIVFDGYFILEMVLNPVQQTHFDKREFTVFLAGQMILYSIIITAIAESSYRIFYQSERCSINVRKLMNKCDIHNMKEELGYLALQIESRLVKFSAAGLFGLDRSLLFTISGAATTYLIILIQFSANPITLDELQQVVHNYTNHTT